MTGRFFIVCTITGLYYVGLIRNNFNSYSFNDELVKINSTYIPRSNIDYIKLDIPYEEFITICSNIGITEQADFKKAMEDYRKSKL